MRPRLEACYFSDGSATAWRWRRLAGVLTSSARLHCPDWDVRVLSLPWQPTPTAHGKDTHVANTQKLEHWNRIVQGAEDGAQILLIDADTFITRPLDALWTMDFDLAYAGDRRYLHYTLNGGVIGLRVSPAVRTFMARWATENRAMLTNERYHRPWKLKYGGINQASLGSLLEARLPGELGLQVHTLRCVEWNCEDSAWPQFDPGVTRIVHVKSRLRQAVFPSSSAQRALRGAGFDQLASLWKAEEARAAALRQGVA